MTRLRLLLAALAVVLAAGCVAGRFPAASSQRPLTMPEGEHQLTLAAGASSSADGGTVGVATALSYRSGITDRVQYSFPLVFTYRLGEARGVELAVGGGLFGLGYRSRLLLASNGDPRMPNAQVDGFTLSPGAVASGRLTVSGNLAFFAGARAGPYIFRTGADAFFVTGGAGLVTDVAEWMSVTPSLQAWSAPYVAPNAQLSSAAEGGAQISAVVAWHAWETLDFILTPSVARGFGAADQIEAGGTIGVDVHWDHAR